LFADDTACHNKIATSNDQDSLKEDLNKLAAWELRWKMAFHPAKCFVLHMTRCHSIHRHDYYLHGQKLEEVSQTKYLGITLTTDMKWNHHVQNTANKANKTLGFLKRNLKIGNKSAKLAAYKALVRPIVEYAGPVWDPYTIEGINAIEKIQRRAARWITNNYNNDIEVNMDALGLTQLDRRRKQARLSAFYRFHRTQIQISTNNNPQLSTSRHSARTAHAQTYTIERSNTTYRQMSFFPRTIRDWNKLPDDIVSASSYEHFQDLLSAYNTAQRLSPA
jgi:hypothetical protein